MEAYKSGSHPVWDCKYHPSLDDEVPLSGVGGRCWTPLPGEVWQEYIKNQAPPDPDDDFHVV